MICLFKLITFVVFISSLLSKTVVFFETILKVTHTAHGFRHLCFGDVGALADSRVGALSVEL